MSQELITMKIINLFMQVLLPWLPLGPSCQHVTWRNKTSTWVFVRTNHIQTTARGLRAESRLAQATWWFCSQWLGEPRRTVAGPFPLLWRGGLCSRTTGSEGCVSPSPPKLKSPMSVDYHCAGFCWFAHKQFLYIENTIYGAFGF
jgi:hypothetical protein